MKLRERNGKECEDKYPLQNYAFTEIFWKLWYSEMVLKTSEFSFSVMLLLDIY